ncbi:MAG: potassium transporter TrkG, partial [Paracoccaceae bacterium]
GWMGGGLIWVAAVAILAPLNLGGFELTAQHANARRQANFISTSERKLFLLRSAQTLMPLYIGLTGALWLGFILSGASGYSGFIFALSVLSTSGITAYQGVVGLSSGIWAEVLIVIFFTLALSRVFWAPEKTTGFAKGLFRDAELRLAIWITILLSCVLFIKQVASSTALLAEYGPEGLLALIWGNLFTILSFLSTTGWSSQYWQPIAPLSNAGIPGFLFLGLGLIGGGIATTAGGVKLLRFYILYLNALREVGRLVHPSSVGKTKSQNQHDLGQGAFAAWIFFMLFGLSLAGITLLLAASGLSFETALALCVSAISTTGPALMMVIDGPFDMIALSGLAKAILCLAMVLGRLEILVILALLRPEIWLRQ